MEGLVMTGENIIMTKALYEWIGKRKIHLKCLVLDQSKGWMFFRSTFAAEDIFSNRYECLDTFIFRGGGTSDIIAQLCILYTVERSMNLQHLLIEDCLFETDSITGYALRCYPNLVSFQSVNSYITDKSIINIAGSCSKLRILKVHSLSTGVKLKDSSIMEISIHCKGLEQLSVVGSEITDESIVSTAIHCRGLLLLNVSSCLLLTDESIKSIATHCTSLEDLDVSGCENLTDTCLIPISIYCTSLQLLKLSHTKLSNEGIYSIATHCKKLRLLNVLHCSNWNFINNPWNNESWKSIESLNISDTNVNDPDIRVIAENCSRLISFIADNCLRTTCVSFITVIYKLYLLPIEPKLKKLCIMGHFGICKPDINYIEIFVNKSCTNYMSEEDDSENGDF